MTGDARGTDGWATKDEICWALKDWIEGGNLCARGVQLEGRRHMLQSVSVFALLETQETSKPIHQKVLHLALHYSPTSHSLHPSIHFQFSPSLYHSLSLPPQPPPSLFPHHFLSRTGSLTGISTDHTPNEHGMLLSAPCVHSHTVATRKTRRDRYIRPHKRPQAQLHCC